ncbi:hypothetical protein [Nonomuraea sp. NPDC050643]
MPTTDDGLTEEPRAADPTALCRILAEPAGARPTGRWDERGEVRG